MSVTDRLARVLGVLRALRPLPLRRRPVTQRKTRHSLTLVSAGSSLNGSIDAPGGLRVEGRLQGDVRVQGSLEVLKDASIIGTEVRCSDLFVAGLIEADVHASGSVTIVAGGRILGDLHCRDLHASLGAQLQGWITLGDQPQEQGVHKRLAVTPDLKTSVAAVDGFQ